MKFNIASIQVYHLDAKIKSSSEKQDKQNENQLKKSTTLKGQRCKKDIVICLQILSLIWLWFYHHNILSL